MPRRATSRASRRAAPRRRNSAVPKRVLAGHSRIWGGRIPAGAREQLEKEYARDKSKRTLRRKLKAGKGRVNAGPYSFRKTKKTLRKGGFGIKSSKRRKYTMRAGSRGSDAARTTVDALTGRRLPPDRGGEFRNPSAAVQSAARDLARGQKVGAVRAAYGLTLAQLKRARSLAVKLKGKRNPRNPADGALEVYEGFHGRASKEWLDIDTPIHEHKYLAALGDLVRIEIKAPDGAKVTLKKFGKNAQGIPAILESNEQRNQLFIDGGDQSVDLEGFGITGVVHESEVLGKAVRIVYFTVKDHLGRDGGEADYKHKFGNQREVKFKGPRERRFPTVLYDTRNRLLSFAGGIYTIPDEGISG